MTLTQTSTLRILGVTLVAFLLMVGVAAAQRTTDATTTGAADTAGVPNTGVGGTLVFNTLVLGGSAAAAYAAYVIARRREV